MLKLSGCCSFMWGDIGSSSRYPVMKSVAGNGAGGEETGGVAKKTRREKARARREEKERAKREAEEAKRAKRDREAAEKKAKKEAEEKAKREAEEAKKARRAAARKKRRGGKDGDKALAEGTYQGIVRLVMVLPLDPVQMKRMEEALLKIEGLSVEMIEGSADEGTNIVASLAEPVPLLDAIKEIPVVSEAVPQGKDIRIVLKSRS